MAVNGEIAKPDFARAIRVINVDVEANSEKNAESRGNLAAAWKIVEDECHVNKKAAKDFRKIRNMSLENRDDYLRTLYGLMQEDGIGISPDLIDRLDEGAAPTMPIVEKKPVDLHTVQ